MTTPIIAKIYTDGACSGNPGPGGWGVIIYFTDGRLQDIGGATANTTNNRMELQASIAALEAYEASGQKEPVTLYTDSEYVRNGITKWISGWKKKGWKTAAGKPVMNQDLWQELDELNSSRVTWQYVKGHSGDPGNERADMIAVKCAHSQQSIGSIVLAPSGEAAAPVVAKVVASKVVAEKAETAYNTDLTKADPAKPDPKTPGSLLDILDRLQMAETIATQGFLITTQELAELVGLSAAAIADRGEEWHWRNWLISRSRKAGNQILWQLERQE
jgi:ribonuclease HI